MKHRALFFDVFGTVVDWRSSIIAEGVEFNRANGWDVDWELFADQWRAMYQPAMQQVRSGERPWTRLDDLHRESLDMLLEQHQLTGLSEPEIIHLNQVWHRLLPWPDSVSALTSMKQDYIIAPMSNGNIALLTNLAKFSGLPWDVILGAEIAQQYKPLPQTYLAGSKALGLDPEQVVMVAAHNDDLEAAQNLGFATAFVPRPLEYGPNQDSDLEADGNWDYVCDDLIELAGRLQGS